MRRIKKGQHGGWRPGAGRKPKTDGPVVPHAARPVLEDRHPAYVRLEISPAVGPVRRELIDEAIRTALLRVIPRGDFRIVHASIQAPRIHLIGEADDQIALANGVRALSISAAHRLNDAIGRDRGEPRRKGRVFDHRYHLEIIDTPTRISAELADVLEAWRRHRDVPDPLPVSRPTTWLLTRGWGRWGEQARYRSAGSGARTM